MTKSWPSSMTTFQHDNAGTVTLIFGLVAILLFSFIGAAVDYGRWSNAHSRTVDALDAALLTAGRTLQTSQNADDAIESAKTTFLVNAQSRLDIKQPKIEVALVDDGAALEATATGKIVTPFLGLINFDALKIHAKSKVAFSAGAGSAKGGSDLEISLMLDVTGSMCADGDGPCAASPKMDAMKAAAGDLVSIILKNSGPSNAQSARIALVPFATRVRLGRAKESAAENLMKKVTDLPKDWSGWYATCPNSTWTPPANSETSGTWDCGVPVPVEMDKWPVMPCVTDRTGPEALTDAAPSGNNWLNGHGGHRFPESDDSSNTPIPASRSGDKEQHAADHWEYNDDGSCDGIDEKNSIMPLTNDKAALIARINDLVAYGATSGTLGTAWSWYMLSPNWSNVWNGTNQPGPYEDLVPQGSNPPKLRKIAVLMTDGVYNTTRGWMDQNPVTMSTNAKQVCTNMKLAGVEVYTVGFDLDSLPAADRARAVDTLQSCGTDISHFYEALNAEQLKQSFRDIAMQLSQLFVAK